MFQSCIVVIWMNDINFNLKEDSLSIQDMARQQQSDV